MLGPCNYELSNCRGTPCFMKSLEALEVQCTCLPKIATTENGRCYQPYTRGPCECESLSIYSNSSPNMIFGTRKNSVAEIIMLCNVLYKDDVRAKKKSCYGKSC